MKPVKSSTIAAVDHDGKRMTVQFHNGGIYDYPDVPKQLYDRMVSAHDGGESIGKFFHANVKTAGFKHVKRKSDESA